MHLFIALELINKDSLPQTDDSALQKGFTMFFVVLGAVAFLMLVIAGLRYIASQGIAEKVTQAKNMIIYSLIGLVIAASAATVVNVVLDRVGQ